jgi:mono/diheme cytochrome c family protein
MIIPSFFLMFAAPLASDQEAHVREIFESSCTMCHGAGDPLNLADVTLSTLAAQTSSTGEPMLELGDPGGSYFYARLIDVEGSKGGLMPPGDEPLAAEQLEIIAAWIAAGVPEDDDAVHADGRDDSSASAETIESEEPVAAEQAATVPDPAPPPGPERVPPPSSDAVVLPKRRLAQPFFGTHQINLQTTTTLGKKTLAYRVHHRFGRLGGVGDRSYLGLASGVVMSMGLEYGIIDGLDVLVRWTNAHLDWEAGVKYVPLRQETGSPVSLGAFASFEGLTDFPENAANRATGNFQLLLSRLWWEQWSTQLTVGYSLFTNHDPNVVLEFEEREGAWRALDQRGTLNVGLASTLWLGKRRRNGLDLEYLLPIPDGGTPNSFYYNGGDANPDGAMGGSWSLGWSGRSGLHLFQVFATNTRNIHTNLVAPGGDTGNPFEPFGDFYLGFNMSRKWRL